MRQGKTQRQEQIVDALNHYPTLRVGTLAERFSVTTETIRRDLSELTEAGLLSRTYGGAVRANIAEPALSERQAILVSERERIARAAVALIPERGLVMIGSGATTVHVARRLAFERERLTVVTHSFAVASVLSGQGKIEVILCPGYFDAGEGATYGAATAAFLAGFNADCAILGASGLGPEGATDAQVESALVYRAMAGRAASRLLVADHSKFGRVFPARVLEWQEIDAFVTDRPPADELADALAAATTELVIAD